MVWHTVLHQNSPYHLVLYMMHRISKVMQNIENPSPILLASNSLGSRAEEQIELQIPQKSTNPTMPKSISAHVLAIWQLTHHCSQSVKKHNDLLRLVVAIQWRIRRCDGNWILPSGTTAGLVSANTSSTREQSTTIRQVRRTYTLQ